jgi:tetratricopeptide (TPR) repeat protein
MKIFVVVIILLMSMLPVQQEEYQGKILIDVGHSSLDTGRILNDLVRTLEINYYSTEFTETLLYLDPYDILVVPVPTEPFTVEELNDIHRFVDDGGGLLLLGESGVLSTEDVEDFNVLAAYYGIEFQRDVVVDPDVHMVLDKGYPEIPLIENFTDHAVTRNVKKIFFVSGCSLRLSQRARPLAWGRDTTYGDRLSEIYGFGGGTYDPHLEKRGEELIVMAYAESGKGRVVALGDTSLFRGRSAAGGLWPQDPLEYYDHKRLALNVVNWLSVKTRMGRVSELVREAESLIEQGDYEEARIILEDVKNITQQAEDFGFIREVAALLVKATSGEEADRLYEEGTGYLQDLDCEHASQSFEKALELYESIGNAEKADKCLTLLYECGDNAALIQRADSLCAEGKTAFRQGNYAEALLSIEEAKTLYETVEYSEKVEECNRLIEEIKNSQKGEEQTEEILQKNRLMLAIVLVVVAGILVVVYVWRRSQPEEEVHPPRRY